MMLRERSMQIKLLRQDGVKITDIAQRFGISRQTVYNHLNRTGEYPKPRQKRSSKLDSHKDYIRARVREFDIPATSLIKEIQANGYDGGLTILRSFIRPLKAEQIKQLTQQIDSFVHERANPAPPPWSTGSGRSCICSCSCWATAG